MLSSDLTLIKDLIAYDTSTDKSNLNILDFMVEHLKPLGFRFRFTHNDDGSKANLLASIGSETKAGVILSGHTDVVPANAEDWSLDPFHPEIRDNRLYGRGSSDMKSFLGLCLSMAPDFSTANLPIHFAFSYDEEIGCVGAPRMIDDLSHLPTYPRLCIVGEPTMMETIIAHKSKTNILCRVLGHECHSSIHHLGINAVDIAAELVQYLTQKQRDIRNGILLDDGYVPPYTTIHTGWIKGGKAVNIVPKECSFEFEIRTLPQEDIASLLQDFFDYTIQLTKEMQKIHPDAGIFLETISDAPALNGNCNSEVARLSQECAENSGCKKVCFGTEAGLFHQAGIPTVVCGPGDIVQAHRADEFITLDQLQHSKQFLTRLGQWLEDQGRTSI